MFVSLESKTEFLLTRNIKSDENRWTLEEHGTIVQANVDNCMMEEDPNSFDVMDSFKRRKVAKKSILSLTKIDASTLWEVMSLPPIFNSITIYGTYMCPTTGDIETRLPSKYHGFVPTYHSDHHVSKNSIQIPENQTDNSTALRYRDIDMKTCKNCKKNFNPHKNVCGECKHKGGWHAYYNDCNIVKCGWGLKNNIGTAHWGCCFVVDPNNMVCPKSNVHEEQ